MITITTAGPASEPLTAADVRLYLRGVTADDALFTSLIKAARVAFEKYSGRYVITQTVTQTMDCFPRCNTLKLLRGPVLSVTSITGYDADSASEVLDPDQYLIDTAGARVVLKDDASWPTVGQAAMSAKVIYTAGYGASAADVPDSIVQGMRHYIAHMHTNRETDVLIPPVVEALWFPFKVPVV